MLVPYKMEEGTNIEFSNAFSVNSEFKNLPKNPSKEDFEKCLNIFLENIRIEKV